MRLSYQVKPHQILFGGWDATPYLDSIGITTPEIEIGETLTWSGDFQVSYNRMAQFAGLDDDDFSPFAHPERWRPDRGVIIELENAQGQTGRIACRIQKYTYDEQNRTGRGTLYQLMDAVNRSRPSEVVETVIGAGGVALAGVVTQLIYAAGGAIGTVSTGGIWGLIDDKVSTRNPIEDAQKLAATCWQWLRHDRGEAVHTISGDPLTHPILFRRSLAEVELEPDLENNNDWHSRSIVTGSYQRAKPAEEDCGDDDKNDLDDQNRPKIIRTTSTATFAEVFPSSNLGSGLTTSEEKTILYQYGNSPISENIQSLWAQVVGDLNIPNPLQVADYLPSIGPSDDSGVVATVTIRQKPAGSIFPQLGTSTTLRVFDIQIESERRKTNLKPWGLLKPSEGANFTLYPAPDEQIDPTSASRPDPSPGRADENGDRVCLEKPVQPEPRQPAPQFEMETVPVRGECTIAPVGWAPIVQLPLVTDFGFLPSQGHANYLACQIAARETRRLYAYVAEMPVPDEWIAADMPGYFRCHLGAAEYEATAVELILTSEDNGSMRLRFRAHRIGTAPNIPTPPPPQPFIPEANGALQLSIPVGGVVGVAGSGSATIQLQAIGGNP
jgi:hypothetical protein